MRKLSSLVTIITFITLDCFGQNIENPAIKETVITGGVGLGSVIAVVTSWERNKSVLWIIIHGILGWLYVFYFILTRRSEERKL